MTMRGHSALGVLVLLTLVRETVNAQSEDTTADRSWPEAWIEQAAPVEDSPLLDFILPDTVAAPPAAPALSVTSRTRLRAPVRLPAGFTRGVYLGSPLSAFQRFSWNAGTHLRGSFVTEKDAGERSLADLVSVHLTLEREGFLRRWVVGDYFIEAGEGVALWRAYDMAKGGDVVSPVSRSPGGLKAYRSADETSFLRGTAAELQGGPVTLTLFCSRRSYDAALDSLLVVHAIASSGYRRTESEIARKGSLGEALLGARGLVEWPRSASVGFTVYSGSYSRRLDLGLPGLGFSGTSFNLVSWDYRWKSAVGDLFGEWALAGGKAGGNSGIVLRSPPGLEMIASYRSYPPQFYAPHGLGFAEGGGGSNETGLYLGIRCSPGRSTHISLYCDQFGSYARSATLHFPQAGRDYFLELSSHAVRRLGLTLRYQQKEYDRLPTPLAPRSDGPLSAGMPSSGIRERRAWRLVLTCALSEGIALRELVELVSTGGSPLAPAEQGMLSSHDVTCTDPATGGRWSFRLLFFRTGSYDSRVQENERDLDGAVSFPALFGQGVRWYLLVRYRLFGRFNLGAKYSETVRDDIRRIGSGLDELPDNRDARVGFQLDVVY